MKVALCLACQPRFVEQAYHSIKENLMDGYDVDVFIHTWIDEQNPYQFRHDGRWNSIQQDPNIKDKILELYKPKKYLFESPKLFKPSIINGISSVDYFRPLWEARCNHFNNDKGAEYFISMIHSMWYSIMMSNLQKEIYAKENGIVYDWVVRTRFDVTYKHKLHYENLDPNILYAASQVHPDHIHDFFAVGNTKNINAYCSLFYNMEYYLDHVSPDWRCGEGILHKAMEHFKVKCQGLDFINILRP
jgi:hypothetical protein